MYYTHYIPVSVCWWSSTLSSVAEFSMGRARHCFMAEQFISSLCRGRGERGGRGRGGRGREGESESGKEVEPYMIEGLCSTDLLKQYSST